MGVGTQAIELAPSTPAIPALEAGDHLTRAEFERRYDAMPHLKKAELLEGEVHMPSPVRWNQHAFPHADLITWMGVYRVATKGIRVGDNGTLRLDLDSEPQPDATMLIEPEFGGRVILVDDYVEGSPELLAEISASSVSIDLNKKFRLFRRNRVNEYLVWRVLDSAIDWFQYRQNQYEKLLPDASGILKSIVFPGLWLDAAALVRFDLARVHQVLQQGLASPEHAEFVAKLQGASGSAS